MRTKWIIVLGLFGVNCFRVTAADEWSQFRGSNGSGVSTAAAIPTEWSPDKNVQWKTKIPGVAWSSPIVWGDKVFLTTAITANQRKPQQGGGFGGGGGAFGGGGGGPGGGGAGRGGFGAPPQPGQILPQFVQDRLSLTDAQKKQLEELQKSTDGKVEKNLTEEQRKQLKDSRGGSGGGGGFGVGGRGGFGGFSQPGQIMSASVQEQLKLSDKQKQQHADIQKDVDGQLDKLFNDDQRKQFKELRDAFGRGGPGGGGAGGGAPGGGRPGGFGGGAGGGRGGFGGGSPPDVVYRWEVHCLDRTTGSVIWKELALEGKPKIATHGSNTYASETPVTDGERVYAYFGMHGLFCYSADGKLVWKKDLGAFPMQMGWGSSSSPVLDGERLFLQIDNEEKSFLVALDKKTGNEVWRVAREERTNWGSPIIWKNKARTELVTPGSQKIRSYDPATGKVLWEFASGGQSNSTPVGDADQLYVGCETRGFGGGEPGGGGGGRGGFGGGGAGGGGSLFVVRAGATGDVTLKEGETSNAGIAWSVPRAGPEKASPLVYQGYLYILRANGGIVTCYDAKSGKQVYRERIPNAKDFWASPWASDGKVYCLDGDGTTHVLKAGAEFKVLGKNSLDEMTWASPAIANGALLLRGVDHLYSIK